MKQAIIESLNKLAQEQDVTILFACESGSRAWGFPSPDSDYDVRFIYVHKLNHYLALEQKKDAMDLMLPGDLDLGGWDLRKTLKLFAGSNIALFEWLGSPIKYVDKSSFQLGLVSLIPDFFNPKKAIHHYLSLAKNGIQKLDDSGFVRLKTLFYVIRALACAEFIHSHKTMPSTALRDVLEQIMIPEPIAAILQEWWSLKQSSGEAGKVALDPILKDVIQKWWEKLEQASDQLHSKRSDMKSLNELFIACLEQTAK